MIVNSAVCAVVGTVTEHHKEQLPLWTLCLHFILPIMADHVSPSVFVTTLCTEHDWRIIVMVWMVTTWCPSTLRRVI